VEGIGGAASDRRSGSLRRPPPTRCVSFGKAIGVSGNRASTRLIGLSLSREDDRVAPHAVTAVVVPGASQIDLSADYRFRAIVSNESVGPRVVGSRVGARNAGHS
jgi:hypothetical protein